MPSQRRTISWSCSVVCVALAAFVGTEFLWGQKNATKPAAVTLGSDVTDRVEVTYPVKLRRSSRTLYYVEAAIRNLSDEPLAGELVMLVRSTGVKGLDVTSADGKLATGEAYLSIVPEGEQLVPGKASASRKIQLKTKRRLSVGSRRRFALDYRIVQLRGQNDRPSDTARTSRVNRPRESRSRSHREKTSQKSNNERRQPPKDKGDSSSKEPNEDSDENLEPIPDPDLPAQPRPGQKDKHPQPTKAEVARVMKVQKRWTVDNKMLEKPGIVGTSTSLNAKGELVIQVYTERAGFGKTLPKEVGGIPVVTKVTGKFRPLIPPPGKRAQAGAPIPGAVDPGCPPDADRAKMRFERPTPIGISSFNSDTAACATGTAGCRVRNEAGDVFALSNNHVFAEENAATVGDGIIQPGQLDNDCEIVAEDGIGTLAEFVAINFTGVDNLVDAAIATVTTATFGTSTPCDGYGTPTTTTVDAVLGMEAQKYGRTTQQRIGVVSAVGVMAVVAYTSGPATFVDQIEFTNPGGTPLGAPGDSGSLIVSRPDRNPIALLFAGSEGAGTTLGNPIDTVLGSFATPLTIDGEAAAVVTAGVDE